MWAIIYGIINVKDVSYSFEIVKVTHYALFTVWLEFTQLKSYHLLCSNHSIQKIIWTHDRMTCLDTKFKVSLRLNNSK